MLEIMDLQNELTKQASPNTTIAFDAVVALLFWSSDGHGFLLMMLPAVNLIWDSIQ